MLCISSVQKCQYSRPSRICCFPLVQNHRIWRTCVLIVLHVEFMYNKIAYIMSFCSNSCLYDSRLDHRPGHTNCLFNTGFLCANKTDQVNNHKIPKLNEYWPADASLV